MLCLDTLPAALYFTNDDQLVLRLPFAEMGACGVVDVVWNVILFQEKDLRIVPDESNEKDICVYLGLAATAFLLVMLYPSNSSAPTTDVSLRPAAQLPPSGAAQEPTMHRKGSGRARLTQSPNTPSSDAMETSSAGSGLHSVPMHQGRI